MTRYYIIFILTIIISSCKNGTENLANISGSDTIIPFHGFWATEKYITTLTKTKSPRQSQDDGEFFQIPKSYNERAYPCVYHEGGADFHIVKSQNSYYLKADCNKNDSTEIAFFENGNKMKIWDNIYVKTQENIGIPEDLLFKGTYMLESKTVTLLADGSINGLDNFNYYEVINDYIGPGMGDEDLIMFGETKSKMTWFPFKFNADTLLIYDYDCTESDERGACLDIKKGALRYKLIRK